MRVGIAGDEEPREEQGEWRVAIQRGKNLLVRHGEGCIEWVKESDVGGGVAQTAVDLWRSQLCATSYELLA